MTIRRKLNSFDAAFCGRKTIESRTNHMKYLTILLVTVPLNIITFSTSFFVPCLCVTLSLSFFASLHLSICRLLVSIVCNCNEIVWPTKTIFSLLCSFDLATRKYRMAKLSSHAHNPNCRVFFIFKPLASSSPWSPMTPTIRKHTKKRRRRRRRETNRLLILIYATEWSIATAAAVAVVAATNAALITAGSFTFIFTFHKFYLLTALTLKSKFNAIQMRFPSHIWYGVGGGMASLKPNTLTVIMPFHLISSILSITFTTYCSSRRCMAFGRPWIINPIAHT